MLCLFAAAIAALMLPVLPALACDGATPNWTDQG